MNFDILFIDDDSIDGSQEIIKKLARKSKKVRYIFRPKKMGIGSAHKDAFKWAYKKNYQILIFAYFRYSGFYLCCYIFAAEWSCWYTNRRCK